ncbi:PadR family transcriptional regulator [Blautia sp.]|uniref:PadR family transcriptional regulator n=1 Tax=Blautia sp. TaxID=1955243 RepID=UPI003520851F
MYYYPVSAVLTECLILSVVEQQDSYGYEISQTVKMVASIKESTLYPILRRAGDGWLSDNLFQRNSRDGNVKYYSITEDGRKQLEYLRKEWREYRDTIDDIVEGRLRK